MLLPRIVCCCLIACLAGCASAPPPKPSGRATESYLRSGEELFQKKKYEEAIAQWKKVKESGIVSRDLSALADLRIADAQFENESYIEAAASYESFRKFHPKNANAPYALYRQAICNYKQISGIDRDQAPVNNAVAMLENFLNLYPASEYAADAREKLADCINKQAQYEIYIGSFYYRFGQYNASAKRLEECIARYPQAPSLDEAFIYLEKAYIKLGEKDKARETYNRFQFRFPTSKHLKEAEKDLDAKKSWMPF
ncbi:MAG TPA: outer membrane protein assembly factor BamD [Geobacteraceae bacterium]